MLGGSTELVPWAFEEKVVAELRKKNKFKEVKSQWTTLEDIETAKDVEDLFELFKQEHGKLTFGQLRGLLKAIRCSNLLDETFKLPQRNLSGM